MSIKRRHFFVDAEVQGALLARTVLYWALSVASFAIPLIAWRLLTANSQPLSMHLVDLCKEFGPAMIVSCLVLPLIAWDSIRTSNRFAGPIYRLRRAMLQMVNGGSVQKVVFRKKDFWRDFAEDFWQLARRIEAMQPDIPIAIKNSERAVVEDPKLRT